MPEARHVMPFYPIYSLRVMRMYQEPMRPVVSTVLQVKVASRMRGM